MPRPISLFNTLDITDQLNRGELILTPNSRLASRIKTAYAIYKEQVGESVVITPNVHSIESWVEQQWLQLLTLASPKAIKSKILSSQQDVMLWEQIIRESELGAVLLKPAATAQQAASAYRSMIMWRESDLTALAQRYFINEDCGAFFDWVKTYEAKCLSQYWLPVVKRYEILMTAFFEQELASAGDILGVGFDDIPPLYQALIDSAGTFSSYNKTSINQQSVSVACESFEDELYTAAVWAKQHLRNDVDATIALVIPDLAQQRDKVERILHEVFEPDYFSLLTVRKNLPFNFSAGFPLADAPVIRAALDGLALCFSTVQTETVTGICQSPFYCLDDSDTELSCALINLILNERNFTVSTQHFRQLANFISDKHFSKLVSSGEGQDSSLWGFVTALQYQATISREKKLSKSRQPSQWVPVFNKLLNAIGWPGKRSLDSQEYQQHSQWQGALQIYGQMNSIVQPHNFTQAVSYLKNIVSNQTFQPETPDSSLQVLGTLEAAGLQFSHLWLMSMSETQWPPASSPNPLLPFGLQREHSMPHASAERELDFSQKISQRFVEDAKHFVVSFPSVVDECEVGISSLFKSFPRMTVEELLGKKLNSLLPLFEIRRRHFESMQLESYEAGNAPTLKKGEVVRGGSGLFANQSACPFKAFVSNRLAITALPEPHAGLSAADRGVLLHRALELVWGKLKSLQGLLSQSEQQLDKLCVEATDYAITEFNRKHYQPMGKRFAGLEQQRLKQLLMSWLEIEKDRADFTVEYLEHPQAFRFSALELKVSVDRIDRLQDGRRVVIDYKTGISNVKQWWGDRPEQPQLPLYSMLYDQDDSVGAIAFAQVRADGSEMKGVGADDLAEKSLQWRDKVKSAAGVLDWPELKQQWGKTLTSLAEDFIAGKADVDPKTSPQTCQYCDFQSVCRFAYDALEHEEVEECDDFGEYS